MKKACLLLSACCFLSIISFSQNPHKILPSDTDPEIDLNTTAGSEHYCYVPAVPNGKLLLFFPGSNSKPVGYQKWMETAVSQGYHVIGLMYAQRTNHDPCDVVEEQGDQYLVYYSREVLFGVDLSPLTEVDVPNSAKNRLVKLLEYLNDPEHFPNEGWGQFLSAGHNPVWWKITASGHSQGGDHAAFLGKYHSLEKVICYSSPRELCPTITEWGTFQTTIDKFRFFTHTEDNWQKQEVIIDHMGVTEDTVNVDTNPESSWGNFLVTSRDDVGSFHKCTLPDSYTPMTGNVPDFQPVWVHLLTE